jgi:hypothetical protein
MLRTPHDTTLFSVVVVTNYNPGPEGARFHIRTVAASLAVTEAFPVGFFSSAY